SAQLGREKKIPSPKNVGGLSDETTSPDDESVVARGGQTYGPLKGGGAKRNHSLSDVSDSDTTVEVNMRCSDSLPTVSGSRSVKRRKAKTGTVAAPVASAPVVGAAAPAASRPVRVEERNTAAGSIGKMKTITNCLRKCVLSPDNVSLGVAGELLSFGGEYEAVLFVLIAENARLIGRIADLEKGRGCFKSVICLSGAPPTASVPPTVVDAARPVVPPKPVETWSVVVRSRNAADTPKEVAKKGGKADDTTCRCYFL
uniref:Uncharacterized protein n=1 Tax=Glossina morsitans morsitans TaxID=37546 RepID=A0A1B0GBC7_GLOMM